MSYNPFPTLLSFQLFKLLLSVVSWAHFQLSPKFVVLNTILVMMCASIWWKNLVNKYLGGIYHSLMENLFRSGFILFIVSEIMFFFGFFWSFFHSCWAPTIFIGAVWPPLDFIKVVEDAFSLCKTMILLSSASTVTVAHKFLIKENHLSGKFLILTCMLGMTFLFLQSKEYVSSVVSMNSMVYSTTFFLLTGFHGLHVTVGLLFLLVCYYRFTQYSFSYQYHQGLEFAMWYWHFVDVVWLGLYGCVYHYSTLLYMT